MRAIKRVCRGRDAGRTLVANRIPKIIVSCSLQVLSTDDASRRLWGSHKLCAVSGPPAQIPAERNSVHGTTTCIVIAPGGRRPHSCSSINLAGNFGIYDIRAAERFRRTSHRVHFTTTKSILISFICTRSACCRRSKFQSFNPQTDWLSYLLTPWRRVFLEKLIVSHLLKKLVAFCTTRRFIAVFTTVPSYRGADKSLVRPGRKQATFPEFYGTWRFITTFTRVHHLSVP